MNHKHLEIQTQTQTLSREDIKNLMFRDINIMQQKSQRDATHIDMVRLVQAYRNVLNKLTNTKLTTTLN